jgi:hypothetical protein
MKDNEIVSDIFIEELWSLRNELLLQPDEYVLKSIISKPYKQSFIDVYRTYKCHISSKKAIISVQ